MTTTARFTLIASGATVATRKSAFPLDEPLEKRALAQAAAMAREIGRADRVWCGPALAARQTAEALGLKAEVDPRLGNLDAGRWAGKEPQELMASEPAALARWLGDPAEIPHGGESMADLVRRIGGWLDEQERRTAHGIAVSHGACIAAAIIHVLEAPPRAFWRIDIPPLSITRLSVHDGQWRLNATGCRLKNSAIGD